MKAGVATTAWLDACCVPSIRQSNQIVIVINLVCEQAHPSRDGFVRQMNSRPRKEQGLVSCPVCGSHNVVRKPSAPYLNSGARPHQRYREHGRASGTSALPSRRQILQALRASRPVPKTSANGSRPKSGGCTWRRRPRRSLRGQASRAELGLLEGESAYCRFHTEPSSLGLQASGALHGVSRRRDRERSTPISSIPASSCRASCRTSRSSDSSPLHSTSKPRLDAQARNAFIRWAIVVEARLQVSDRTGCTSGLPRFLGSCVS